MPELPLAPPSRRKRPHARQCYSPKPPPSQRFQAWLERLIRKNRGRPHPRKYLLPPSLVAALGLPDQNVVIREDWSTLHVSTQSVFVRTQK